MTILESYRRITLRKKSEMARLLNVSLRTYSRLEDCNTESARIIEEAIALIVGKPGAISQSKHVTANYVRKAIDKYRAENPDSTWNEIYENIPSHYKNMERMRKNYYEYRYRNGLTKKIGNNKFLGVFRRGEKYIAKIRHNGKILHLGTFEDPIEAAKVWDKKAIELRGYEARTNKTIGRL